MKNKMTMEEALWRVLEAVEYYDEEHEAVDDKDTIENKDYVWEGYKRLMEILNERKGER